MSAALVSYHLKAFLKLNPNSWGGHLKGFEIIFLVDYELRLSIVSIRVCYLVSLTSKIWLLLNLRLFLFTSIIEGRMNVEKYLEREVKVGVDGTSSRSTKYRYWNRQEKGKATKLTLKRYHCGIQVKGPHLDPRWSPFYSLQWFFSGYSGFYLIYHC